MKFHICNLNWTVWSNILRGYTYKMQVRYCTVCHRENHRTVGYVDGVQESDMNEQMNKLLVREK